MKACRARPQRCDNLLAGILLGGEELASFLREELVIHDLPALVFTVELRVQLVSLLSLLQLPRLPFPSALSEDVVGDPTDVQCDARQDGASSSAFAAPRRRWHPRHDWRLGMEVLAVEGAKEAKRAVREARQ